MKSHEKTLEESIIELYLSLKIRKNDEFDPQAEREKLKSINSKIILEYIKSSIEIIVNVKVENRINELNAKLSMKEQSSEISSIDENEPINEYEGSLRHLEAEIRNHIKIEHQLKLHTETLQSRIEELEKSKDDLKQKLKSLQEQLNTSKVKIPNSEAREIEFIKSENNNLKLLIKSYEDRNNIIIDLEKKLRLQQARYEKDVKDLENAYKEKIKSYLRINLNKNTTNSKKNLNSDSELSRNNNVVSKLEKDEKHNTKTSSCVVNQISHRASSVTDRKKEIANLVQKRNEKNNNVKFIIDEIKEQKQDILHKQKNNPIDSTEFSSSKLNRSNNIQKESSKCLLKIAESSDINALYVPKTHRKIESSSSYELQKNNKHARNYSFDKTNKSNISSTTLQPQLNNVPSQINHKNSKKIYEMKDQNQNKHQNTNNKSVPTSSLHSNKISMVNLNPNNSSVFNSGGHINAPLINNINIYAANMNNFKSNDINVRQYIFNKINKPKSSSKNARSSSVTNQ